MKDGPPPIFPAPKGGAIFHAEGVGEFLEGFPSGPRRNRRGPDSSYGYSLEFRLWLLLLPGYGTRRRESAPRYLEAAKKVDG